MSDSPRPSVPAGAAIYIATVQFLFVTTWTIYVIFLPRLLDSAGLPGSWSPWILVLDQLVFMVADMTTGVYADRVQRTLGRIGPSIVGWTVISCIAFLLLPHVVRLGSAAPVMTATIVRIVAVLARVPKSAALAPALAWVPVVLCVVGGVAVGMLALHARPPPAVAAA